MFDGITGWFAAHIMARMNVAAEDEAVRRLTPQRDDKILVIGFGPGLGLQQLLTHPVSEVVGVDPSSVMNRMSAKRNRAALHDRRLRLIEASVADMQWPEGAYFDGAIAVHSLQMCRPFDPTAQRLSHLLKPQARLVSITHGWAASKDFGDEARFATEISDGLRRAGFASVQCGQADAEKGTALLIEAQR